MTRTWDIFWVTWGAMVPIMFSDKYPLSGYHRIALPCPLEATCGHMTCSVNKMGAEVMWSLSSRSFKQETSFVGLSHWNVGAVCYLSTTLLKLTDTDSKTGFLERGVLVGPIWQSLVFRIDPKQKAEKTIKEGLLWSRWETKMMVYWSSVILEVMKSGQILDTLSWTTSIC